MNDAQKEMLGLVKGVEDNGMNVEYDSGSGTILYNVSDKMKVESHKNKFPTLCINNVKIEITIAEAVNLRIALETDLKAWITLSKTLNRNVRREG